MQKDPIVTPKTPVDNECRRYISWSAILAGALVGIGLNFLFHLFNVSIGLSVFSMKSASVYTFAIGGFIGLLIGVIVAMFLAGWIAGYFSGECCPNEYGGAFHGFAAWCAGLFIIIIFATQISQFIASQRHALYSPVGTNIEVIATTTMTTLSPSKQSEPLSSESKIKDEQMIQSMGTSLFVLFIVFFVGALSSCFGGCFGVKCRYKKEKSPPIG